MKRTVVKTLCLLLCLLLALPCAAQADLIDDLEALAEMDSEDLAALAPTPKPTATATPKPTPTATPHSWDQDFSSCNFWLNPKDGHAYAKWEKKGQDLLFKPCIENLTDSYTVDAVDFVIYCTNAYGDVIIPDGEYSPLLYYSLSLNLKPGKHAYTGYCKLPGMRNACKVYIAISRYHLKNGWTEDCVDTSQSDYRDQYYFYNWTVS